MEKKYKLKEEVKKYVDDDYHFRKGTLEWWENNCFTLEALEEVEERVEINIVGVEVNLLMKNSRKIWTEQERELIEFVVNEIKTIDNINNLVVEFCDNDFEFATDEFTKWLKQRKH